MSSARPDEPRPEQAPVLLVTGLSGAGKSTALKILEDLGFEAVDNLPLSLLAPLVSVPAERRLAIGIDARTRAFSPERLRSIVGEQARGGRPIRILFLDCAGHELVRRFSETRRRHPMAADRPAGDGIALERELLSDLRRVADVVIDTTDMAPNDLRRAIATRFAAGTARPLTITILSFGYARGVPRDADIVFDMRFLANPHWDLALRPLTGCDPAVQARVAADPLYAPALDRMLGLLTLLLPGYAREGRAYLTVAFGCTGGRHRSVAVAEAMASALAAAGWPNSVVHRDRAQETADEDEAPPVSGAGKDAA
ncbi:MAG: RNase adapter RapZ [Sphingomonadaceae bacterium]